MNLAATLSATLVASYASLMARGRSISQARPLRIVRVVELDEPRASAGRMVISGRMADVCAELDRMAAREAAGY